MRIRAGFVTNSSSTSFLIITRDDLEEGAFLDLMGVALDSPIAVLFRELFSDVIEASQYLDLAQVDRRTSPADWFHNDRLSETMIARLEKAAAQGLKAYYGNLSSDETPVQSFFCTDAFEVENDQIYFNCLECAW